jgi:hypothetical protein
MLARRFAQMKSLEEMAKMIRQLQKENESLKPKERR